MKNIKTLVATVALTLTAGIASATTLENINASFDRGFGHEQYSFNQVQASFDRAFVDNERKVDYNTIILASFQRDLRIEDHGVYAKETGRNSYELALLGWEDVLPYGELNSAPSVIVSNDVENQKPVI